MSVFIYAIREIGTTEARYIGRTTKSPEKRLAYLTYTARRAPRKSEFDCWLLMNRGRLEAITLRNVPDNAGPEAERGAVALCLRLGHRLFNQWLVPAEQRICGRSKYETPELARFEGIAA